MIWDTNEVVKVIIELFCVIIFCATIGAGIGWLQGAIIKETTHVEGAIAGGMVAGILGPILYYLLLRGDVTVSDWGLLILGCAVLGTLSALLFDIISIIITPLTLILGCIIIGAKHSEK